MIYFDSGATTLQKPPAVSRATARAVVEQTSPGRGGHPASMLAAETVYACREAAATLFCAPAPECVVFTHNATHALNIAIKSLVEPGDRVVISGYEHNSVVRPLYAIGAEVVVVTTPLFDAPAMVRAFDDAILPDTKLVVVNHVSNVFGFVLPVEEIARICNARGVALVVDASQSAGVIPVDMAALGAEFIAMPGHKGLYGPQGTGLLLCKGVPAKTIYEGGTGSHSKQWAMPEDLPDRLEVGTHNVPGINGLLAGINFVKTMTTPRILEIEHRLLTRLIAGMRDISGVTCFVAEDMAQQTGVLSFTVDGIDCERIAEALGEKGICVRAGLHCSPLAHESAGTLDVGTVRVSFSVFNTGCEVDQFLFVLEHVIKTLKK